MDLTSAKRVDHDVNFMIDAILGEGPAGGGGSRDFAPVVGGGQEIADAVEGPVFVIELGPGTASLGPTDPVFDQPLAAVLVQ
jgi:hypothetical protein